MQEKSYVLSLDESHYLDQEGNAYRRVSDIKTFLYGGPADVEVMLNSSEKSAKYRGYSRKEIRQEWADKRDSAAAVGKKVHRFIEEFLRAETKPSLEAVLDQMRNEFNEKNRRIPGETSGTAEFRTFHHIWSTSLKDDYELVAQEQKLGAQFQYHDGTKLSMAGAFDCLMQHKESKELWLVDWKVTKDLVKSSKSFNRTVPPSVMRTYLKKDGTKWDLFELQLNLYRTLMLSNKHTLPTRMSVICLHQNHKDTRIMDVEIYNSGVVFGAIRDLALDMKQNPEKYKEFDARRS